MTTQLHEPELDPVAVSLSKVKLTRNTRGVTWEITAVEGITEIELERLRDLALAQHDALSARFPE